MRVVHLIKGLGRGGAEQLLLSGAPYLDREELQYQVAYVLPWKDALAPELQRAGLPVRCLGGGKGAGWLRRLRVLVEDEHIDLIHAHLPFAAIGARAVVGKSIRIVYTEHNQWQRYHWATYWANALTYPRNDHVFAVSDEVRHSIRYPRPLRHRRMPPVETLYHGIDPGSVGAWGEADRVRAELGIPDGVPLVGTVANFKPHKGQEYLLRAAAIVRRRVPDTRFVLVGVGPREGQMRREADQLGLDGAVSFAGFRDDAPRVVRALDVFVLPSENEGLPIALLEAMALGRPVVATRVGGTPEVLQHGVQGLLVPPRSPEQLADAIITVLEDRLMRERMGEAGRSRSAEFDIRTAVARMETVYEELLA